MATDKTEPRTGLIIGLAITAVLTLAGLRVIFQTYFLSMVEHEEYLKIATAPHTQLDQLTQRQNDALAHGGNGAIPIEQAVAQLVAPGRPSAIAVQPSTDYGALAGWAKFPANLGLDGLVHPAGSTAPGAAAPATPPPAGTPAAMAPGSAVPGTAAPVVPSGSVELPRAVSTPTGAAPPSTPMPTAPSAPMNAMAPGQTPGGTRAVVQPPTSAPSTGHVPQH